MASGKITGSVSGQYGSSHAFWIDWSSTPNAVKNQSVVTASAYLQSQKSGYYAYNLDIPATSKKISIGGTVATSKTKGIDTRNNAKVLIATITKTVNHDANGYATVEISSSFPQITSNYGSGSASKEVTLDKIDTSLPNFGGEPIVISNIKQTSVGVSFSSTSTLDKIEYSIDGKKTWVSVGSKSFTISGLKANTSYSLYIRIRKKSNQKTQTSSVVSFKTLPIYITGLSCSTSLQIEKGKTQNLKVTISPQNASIKALKVVSSNSAIVKPITGSITTSGNVVTIPLQGVKKGSATITISATDGSGKSIKTSVRVLQSVTGVKVSPNYIEVAKGSSFDVAYNVLPTDADNKKVTITSSDTSVVQVSGKTATALENGVCTITVTTQDHGLSASMQVNVVGNYTWYDYSTALDILNAEDVQRISSNIRIIRSILLTKGYTTDNLNPTDALKTSEFVDMFDILQNIEYNLDIINATDIKSVYYVEPKTIGEYAPNKEEIWRWLQILNDLYGILIGERARWGYLLCTDGCPTIDGKLIILRGDLIG
jgi:uncharacterized protein YjdB